MEGDVGCESSQALCRERCLFPVLNTSCEDDKANERITLVHLGSQDSFSDLCDGNDIELSRALQVAWCILLRCYIGSDYPAFHYFDDLSLEPCERIRSAGELRMLDLSRDREVKQLLRAVFTPTVSESETSGAKWANSAITWNRAVSCCDTIKLILEARRDCEMWSARLRYHASLLSEDQADNVADLLEHIISGLRGVSSWRKIDVISPRSMRQLFRWNSIPPNRIDACVHEFILRRCETQPNSVAVCAWDGSFSYAELDSLSSNVARHLIQHGVGPEIFVAVYFDKSRWTAIALMAVMRAGGAFLMLDPALPQARLQNMCCKLNVRLALTPRHLATNAVNLVSTVLILDNDNTTLFQLPTEGITLSSHTVRPENALFAVYTSGSTGNPKGIVISHASYCSSHQSFASALKFDSSTRHLQFASYAFDASVQEHLSVLMTGGCVCTPSEGDRRFRLAKVINDFRVNSLTLTPTVARVLSPASIPTVGTVMLVGEAVLPSDLATWCGHVHLLNGYGPAECSVCTTAHTFAKDTDPKIIGSATAATCWIVDPDDHHKLVPVGAIGELLIEGPIVGRGYVGNEVQTQDRFITPPRWRFSFSQAHPEEKMYKTGDLVQYVADGLLRYIGRKDSQVKLRGQRLELGEVEHHIRNLLPGTDYGVVADLIIPKGGKDPILAGFIQLCSPQDPEESSADNPFVTPCDSFRQMAGYIQECMSDRLPRYMIPSVMIPLKRIPKTATGKADRRRLGEATSQLTRRQLDAFINSEVEEKLPVSLEEQKLCQLVEKVLGVNVVGMNDNFFNLGGDSVRAMQMVRVAHEAGLDLSSADILQSAVLADIALKTKTKPRTDEVIRPFALVRPSSSRQSILEAVQKACGLSSVDEIEDVYPCTPAQQGMIALSAKRSGATYVTRVVSRLPSSIELARLKMAWDTVCKANPILRTRIVQGTEDHAWQVVVSSAISWDHGLTLERYVKQDDQKPMWPGDPLMRLAIVEADTLVLTIHHALYDGWSLPGILRAVDSVYLGLTPPQWKPFNVFVDYLTKLDWRGGEEFWQAKLHGFSGTLFPSPPPADHERINVMTTTRSVSLDVQRALAVTTTTAIQFAWALTLAQYADTDDVVFGVTLSGRNAPVDGIDQIMGPTLTTLPMRVKLDASSTAHNALQQLQNDRAAMLPFEHIGLQKISLLSPEATSACRFQSLLIVQPSADDVTPLTIFQDSRSIEVVDNYALTLEAKLQRANVALLEASFDPAVIDEPTVEGILRQFVHNMEQLTNQRNTRLQDMVPINQEDLQTIRTWNSHLPPAVDHCIHEFIRQISEANPTAPAVDAWDGRLSYGQLETLSTNLAAHMQALGATRGGFVGVYLGRTLWTVVSMLAAMKTGAAFLLLELTLPLSRLQQLCQDAGATLVISSEEHMASAVCLGPRILGISEHRNDWQESQALRLSNVTPADPVYVVFTSGSTGRPKGVVIEHRAFLTSALKNGSRQGIDSSSRVLQLASFTFDASIAEFLYPLVQGGCVCIPDDIDARNNLEDASTDLP